MAATTTIRGMAAPTTWRSEPFTSYPPAGIQNAIKNGTALVMKPNQVIETDLAAVAYESEVGHPDRPGWIDTGSIADRPQIQAIGEPVKPCGFDGFFVCLHATACGGVPGRAYARRDNGVLADRLNRCQCYFESLLCRPCRCTAAPCSAGCTRRNA